MRFPRLYRLYELYELLTVIETYDTQDRIFSIVVKSILPSLIFVERNPKLPPIFKFE